MPTGTLPASGKAIWERVYDKALKGSCKGDEKCAAGSAWKAVKNAGWRKVGDKWVKKSVVEFSLRIERASYDKATNQRRWRAVASDTDEDIRHDNMSMELFNDFLARISSGEQVPEEFRSEFWSGGMPYISISHYPDLNGQGVPGTIESTYIDGNMFKSKGTFNDTVLGRKCFEAINEDLYGVNKGNFDKVRISIAFLDWMHKHKSNGFIFERKSIYDVCPECIRELIEEDDPQGKVYLKGHLIHEALTRVPVNRRTSMEVDKSMAESIRTRKEDAASIIGEEEAEMLETAQAKATKSQALVEFSDVEDECDPEDEECQETEKAKKDKEHMMSEVSNEVEAAKTDKKEKEDGEEDSEDDEEYRRDMEKKTKANKSDVEELSLSAKMDNLFTMIENKFTNLSAVADNPPTKPSPIGESIAELLATFADVSERDIPSEEKLTLIQQSYAALGTKIVEVIKSQDQPVQVETPNPVVDNSQITQLADIVTALSGKVDLLVAKINDASKTPSGPSVPERRSFQPPAFNPMQNMSGAVPNKPMSIKEFAERSVGLS